MKVQKLSASKCEKKLTRDVKKLISGDVQLLEEALGRDRLEGGDQALFLQPPLQVSLPLCKVKERGTKARRGPMGLGFLKIEGDKKPLPVIFPLKGRKFETRAQSRSGR